MNGFMKGQHWPRSPIPTVGAMAGWCRDAPDDELTMPCVIALDSQEAELAGDDRDADNDHDGDIFADVFNHLKPPRPPDPR
jgi:hypothetical protein